MIKEFTKALRSDQVVWKIQNNTNWDAKNKRKLNPNKDVYAVVVPYIDNRAVLDRLDSCFGAGNWNNEFKEIEGGFLCTILIKIDNEWVSKTDGAGRSKIEAVKGGLSDSMKRAAHQWGLGRELYSYPKILVGGGSSPVRFLSKESKTALKSFVTTMANGEFHGEFKIIKQ